MPLKNKEKKEQELAGEPSDQSPCRSYNGVRRERRKGNQVERALDCSTAPRVLARGP